MLPIHALSVPNGCLDGLPADCHGLRHGVEPGLQYLSSTLSCSQRFRRLTLSGVHRGFSAQVRHAVEVADEGDQRYYRGGLSAPFPWSGALRRGSSVADIVALGVVDKVRHGEEAVALGVAGGLRLGDDRYNARALAGQHLVAVVIASVGQHRDLLASACRKSRAFRLMAVKRLRPIAADIGHVMGDDQMVLGIDGDLHIVADNASALAAGRHRAGIGIGQERPACRARPQPATPISLRDCILAAVQALDLLP